MAIPAIPQVTNPDEDKEAKQDPAQFSRKALGLIKKIGELTLELQETLRLDSERQRRDDERARARQRQDDEHARAQQIQDDERLRAILNRASGGGIERLIRSLNLPQTEKAFLRKKRWRLGRDV